MQTGESLFHDRTLTKKIEKAGLDEATVRVHLSRFLEFQTKGMKNPSFKVKDTCRIDNGRIVPYSNLSNFPTQNSGIISLIPAAGSSTRYIQPLYDLLRSAEGVPSAKDSRRESQWVLPTTVRGTRDFLSLERMLTLPKGLFPCVHEGYTFLELKLLEQKALGTIHQTVCVVPSDSANAFSSALKGLGYPENDILFLEQGSNLLTPRLDQDGRPLSSDGQISLAPAGHGSLIHLFPQIKDRFPDSDVLFIRNIDNVIGCKQENLLATQSFLGAHRFVLDRLYAIREALKQKNIDEAYTASLQILERFPLRNLGADELKFLSTITSQQEQSLYLLLLTVFQTPLRLCSQAPSLLTLLQRPLSFMGQVPNLGHDRGGTPMLIESKQGDLSVCLELPHMSGEDQEKFLHPQIATHFNPVFVALELSSSIDCYQLDRNPYWIFAEKNWQGRMVYYHESLLYEILGNSEMTNLVFLELPRSIFNPHKTLDDTIGRSLEHWM